MSRQISFLLKVCIGSLTVILLIGAILSAYILFIQKTNEYLGYFKISYHFHQLAVMFVIALIFGSILARAVVRPSDLFFHIYFLFVLIPFSTLAGVRGEMQSSMFFLGVFVLSMPLVIIYLIRKIKFFDFNSSLISNRTAIQLLLILSAAGIFLLSFSGIEQVTFDMGSSYDRRLEGREKFETGAIKSYLISMVSNSLIPSIAFIAGYRNRITLLLISLIGVAFFYYFLGLKAPALFVMVGYFCGNFFRCFSLDQSGRFLVALILITFLCFYLELVINDYSFMGDYFLRRAFAVPPFLNQVYTEIIADSLNVWNLWSGVVTEMPITMYVGDYLGDSTLNANTNTFFYSLAGAGIGLYISHIFIVGLVLCYCDLRFAKSHDAIWMWIILLFSLLVIEQSVTTVLISSGIAPLILIYALVKEYPNFKNKLI